MDARDPKVFEAIALDPKVWTTSEICSVLFGLLVVSQRKSWWLRWLWAPWDSALLTAIDIFTKDAIIRYSVVSRAQVDETNIPDTPYYEDPSVEGVIQ